MVDGSIHVGHHPGCDDHIQVFLAPVILAGRCDARYGLKRFVTTHLDPGFQKIFDQAATQRVGDILVDQQALGRSANAGAPGLGVHHDARGFLSDVSAPTLVIAAERDTLQADLDLLRAEIAKTENLTRRLSDEYLDLDLLDQQARSVLGLIRADEIVIR